MSDTTCTFEVEDDYWGDEPDWCVVHNSYRSGGDDRCLWSEQEHDLGEGYDEVLDI